MGKDTRLRYVNDSKAGIRRRGRTRFHYVSESGRRIRDARTLERIRALAIPPAWSDVWICKDCNGHVQATGRDARGRKQYRYHPDWIRRSDSEKHERLIAFGAALPRLRRALRRSLAEPGLPKDKVVAMVVAVMGATLIRVGNAEYAASNRSYGLTTLRDRHVEAMRRGGLRFRFRGKSGKSHDVLLTDSRLVRLVRRCQQLPGQILFQYVDADGRRHPVNSSDINAWLKNVMGQDFSTRDFRTWGATAMAFRALACTALPTRKDGRPAPENRLAAVENTIVEQVAEALGNTKSVCRKAYIDPLLFTGWRAGQLTRHARGASGARQWEAATLRFLRAQRLAKPPLRR
ncbi:DNA topoisomerase IB [Tahibacter caeni]|uniref:DNA topoisomerase IB n=1 Tax=Tahibacter caeni TaxID=1453545 RepID=UPI002147C93C|nr:DNA topoisomerase IB [Tahibacter caeni]